MRNRKGHFMPETLLDSQFSVLEPPEDAITVSVENTPEKILEEILSKLRYK
jgi:gluconate kinase